MPALLAWIGAFILSVLPQLIRFFTAHAAVALGFSLVTYTGLNLGIDRVATYLRTQIGGLPGDMAAVLGLLGVDTGISMILSTLMWVIVYKGLNHARSYRHVWRKPGSSDAGNFEA